MGLKLSVIIPVYNEASTIEAVLERIAEVEIPVEKEVIIVDDGSSDGTRTILAQRAEHGAYDWENVHLSPVNFGKGAAIRIGLKHATGDMVLIQDAEVTVHVHNASDVSIRQREGAYVGVDRCGLDLLAADCLWNLLRRTQGACESGSVSDQPVR